MFFLLTNASDIVDMNVQLERNFYLNKLKNFDMRGHSPFIMNAKNDRKTYNLIVLNLLFASFSGNKMN